MEVFKVVTILLLGTTVVTSLPFMFGKQMLPASGVPLYHDIGKYHYGGLLGGLHGYGKTLYHDLHGTGYYGMHGFGKNAYGVGLYAKLGYGYFSKNVQKFAKMYNGYGSTMYGEPNFYGLITGKRGFYKAKGSPWGGYYTAGHLAHGMGLHVVPVTKVLYHKFVPIYHY